VCATIENTENFAICYRFGFNGKENENEWDGQVGSKLDFGARIYDSRLGRWLAIDPLKHAFPGWTPYRGFLDNPIVHVDKEGKVEWEVITIKFEGTGEEMKIRRVKSDLVMHDGKVHMVGGSGVYHDEYWAYDFETVYTITIKKDGTCEKSSPQYNILYENGVKDEDYAFTKRRKGETETEFTNYSLFGSGDSQPDGFYLTSKDGGGKYTTEDLAWYDPKRLDVQGLLDLFSLGIKAWKVKLPKADLEKLRVIASGYNDADKLQKKVKEEENETVPSPQKHESDSTWSGRTKKSDGIWYDTRNSNKDGGYGYTKSKDQSN